MNERLDADILRRSLNYNAETGVFTWKKRRRVKHGATAGNVNQNGYINIKINGRLYKAHRLAWMYIYGEFPSGVIDHINQIKTDNRIANLRDVHKTVNGHNRPLPKYNTTGLIGAFYEPRFGGKWFSKITHRGVRKFLGYFDTKENASSAYQNAREEIIRMETQNAK